jgi:yeast amino acid transporter
MNDYKVRGTSSSSSSSPVSAHHEGGIASPKSSWPSRFVDSFREDSNSAHAKLALDNDDDKVFDVESAAKATANTALSRKLKARHLQMIAIGGSVGMDASSFCICLWNTTQF